ncbi:MAG: hypothetical protein IKE91_04840 [Clostridia bacterium]|nr:hypothetical protein [Clostridia bacterium]
MIRYLFVILILSIGSVIIAFKGRKYEEGLPITIALITIFLYIFYLFDLLKVGYYIIVTSILILYVRYNI